MKILVISDVHANIWALQAVMRAEKNYDYLAFAGDVVDYGTAPSEVISWLRNAPDTFIVQGNHDLNAVKIAKTTAPGQVGNREYKWIHYNLERMKGQEIDWLESLPKSLCFDADGWTYLLRHQYREDSYETIENRSQFLAFWRKYAPESHWYAKKKRVIFGHSHRQCIHILEDKPENQMEWLNPGSISYRRPDDPEKTAQYMTIIDGKVTMKCVGYDRSSLYEEALRQARQGRMMITEIQDFMFFFGDAKSTRESFTLYSRKE